MLVHHCQECGALSINRIAADDDNERLWELYRRSLHSLPPALRGAALVQGFICWKRICKAWFAPVYSGRTRPKPRPLPADCFECV